MSSNLKVRIDKWLWAIRLFKSRSLSTDACKSGQVKVAGESVKASYMTKIGDHIMVKKNGFNFTYEVLETIEKRVGAPIAITCYRDLTPPEEMIKFEAWFLAGKKGEFRDKGIGRPTKKDRRSIDGFKEID